jgi:flagellar basal-body rod protein FlgB
MNLDAIPLFSMLKGRLSYLSERQRLIAQNVANADTPGYMPRDLKPFTLPAQPASATGSGPSGVAMAQTAAGHMAPPSASGAPQPFKPQDTADSETTLDGNHVVLEDEMMKMSESRLDYQAAIGFYQQSLNLLRMAARAPGK